MLELLKKKWWKIIGAVLVLYTIVGGMLVPLGPTIDTVNFTEQDDFMQVDITASRTSFQDAENSLQLWLNNEDLFICPERIEVASNGQITAWFAKPLAFATDKRPIAYNLVVNNNKDGTVSDLDTYVLGSDEGLMDESETSANCATEVAQNKPDYFSFPNLQVLKQSIRNLLYHVPMWFAMMLLLTFSLIYSIVYLRSENELHDQFANHAAQASIYLGLFGLLTGMLWANYTWGSPWVRDPKLNGAAVGMLVYLAYMVLRGSLTDEKRRGRLAAVYNIFAYVLYVLFIFVIPRIQGVDSIHPGQGGNPAFSEYDLDSALRIFFYPAVIGWTIIGFWIMSIQVRYHLLREKLLLD